MLNCKVRLKRISEILTLECLRCDPAQHNAGLISDVRAITKIGIDTACHVLCIVERTGNERWARRGKVHRRSGVRNVLLPCKRSVRVAEHIRTERIINPPRTVIAQIDDRLRAKCVDRVFDAYPVIIDRKAETGQEAWLQDATDGNAVR